MGITSIHARVSNLGDAKRFAEVEFIVDSGAVHSVVPGSVLEEIGVERETTQRFTMVDGQGISRDAGLAVFEYDGKRTAANVIFGGEGDLALIGATTLEGFGFVLDPLRRELRPMVMRL